MPSSSYHASIGWLIKNDYTIQPSIKTLINSVEFLAMFLGDIKNNKVQTLQFEVCVNKITFR